MWQSPHLWTLCNYFYLVTKARETLVSVSIFFTKVPPCLVCFCFCRGALLGPFTRLLIFLSPHEMKEEIESPLRFWGRTALQRHSLPNRSRCVRFTTTSVSHGFYRVMSVTFLFPYSCCNAREHDFFSRHPRKWSRSLHPFFFVSVLFPSGTYVTPSYPCSDEPIHLICEWKRDTSVTHKKKKICM